MIIDTDSRHFSPEEATQLLEAIYQLYHGRAVDAVGQTDWQPTMERYGFLGLARVLSIVIGSKELADTAQEELDDLWQQYFQRKPTDEEKDRYLLELLYFREAGRQELQSRMRRAIDVQEQASILTKNGDPVQAQVLIESAMSEVIAGWWVLWHDYGLSLLRQGKYQQAIPHYEQAIDYNLDDNWEWSCEDLRVCYENLGVQDRHWYATGIEYFRDLVKQRPDRWAAWHALAWLTWQVGKPAEAIPCYHQAINGQPDQKWQYSCEDLRICYEQTGRQEEACEYYGHLVASRPDLWSAWHSLGHIAWHYKKDLPLAVEHFGKAIQHHPDGGWYYSWLDMGWCLSELGRFDKAGDAYRKAMAIDSENAESWHHLGNLAERRNRTDEAIGCFQRALWINPKAERSWLDLGKSNRYRNPARYSLAWLAYREAVKINGNLEQGKIALAELETEGQPWTELDRLLTANMKLIDLKRVCLPLNIDYDELSGSLRQEKIADLLLVCRKDNKGPDLILWIGEERPDLIPPILGDPPPSNSTPKTPTNLHSHLDTQFQELTQQHRQLSARISALDTDIGRELDSERRLVLEQRRQECSDERERIVVELSDIEGRLEGHDGPKA